jgi:hypothetical protein
MRSSRNSPRSKPSLRILLVVLAIALLATGCRSRQGSPPPPSPAETREPAVSRIGVVDIVAVARAHPRWSEVEALNKKIQRAEVEIAGAPPLPPPPAPDLRPALDAEALQLRAEFDKELAAMREDLGRQLEAFAASLREQQKARLLALQKQLEEEGKRAIEARHAELDKQLRDAELAIMDEYRYPMLNLRLRAEVAGLSSEQEGREVVRQIQALQQEREERLRARKEETAKALEEFQKATEADLSARFKTAQDALSDEGTQQLTAREQQVQSELKTVAAQREKDFRERLDARRRELIRTAEQQLRGRQGTYLNDLSARARQARAELLALQEQRARLEDSILAEVKIEVATIAQQERLDVVLSRSISNPGGIDITQRVVQKFKR